MFDELFQRPFTRQYRIFLQYPVIEWVSSSNILEHHLQVYKNEPDDYKRSLIAIRVDTPLRILRMQYTYICSAKYSKTLTLVNVTAYRKRLTLANDKRYLTKYTDLEYTYTNTYYTNASSQHHTRRLCPQKVSKKEPINASQPTRENIYRVIICKVLFPFLFLYISSIHVPRIRFGTKNQPSGNKVPITLTFEVLASL